MFVRSHQTHQLALEQLEKREMLSSGAAAMFQPTARGVGISDDYGNSVAQAAQLSISAAGSAIKSGKIETIGDVDVFKFIAPVSGKMTIQELAAAGSRLDSYLYVYDAKQQLLAQNDDYSRSLNSRVEINVTAGATYYIKASAYGRSTGAYTVQLVTTATTTPTDDYGNTTAQATQVTLSSSGSGTQSGKIEQSGDVDMFKIVAPVTGTMTIQQSASSGSSLDSYLYVYDASGNLLTENNNNGSSSNSQVQISVVANTTYYVKAAGYQTSTGAYALSFSTTATTTTPTESGFQITATITGFTSSTQQIIQQAIDRWETIIVGDLADVTYSGRVIDDIEIAISGITIDGAGSVLGQSTATAYRSGSDLPYMGYIQLDTADVATMLSDGSLLGVVTHEIAHVLGFGVIWSDLGLLTGTRTSNPGFTGANAVAAYNAIFGTNATAVPVEADGGSGTRLSHWDETVFDNELMTGWYNSGETNPLSAITVASMADLGYQVNMAAADSYTRPTSSVTTSSTLASSTRQSYRNVAYISPAFAAMQMGGSLPIAPVSDYMPIENNALAAAYNANSDANTTAISSEVNGRLSTRLARQNEPILSSEHIRLVDWCHGVGADTHTRQAVTTMDNLWDFNLETVGDRHEAVDSWFAKLDASEVAMEVVAV